jgi:hypothetical protein
VLHASNKKISIKEANSFSDASISASLRKTSFLPKVDDDSVRSGLTPGYNFQNKVTEKIVSEDIDSPLATIDEKIIDI